MAAIDFKKLMAEELAKAKARAFIGDNLKQTGGFNSKKIQEDDAVAAFMKTQLEFGMFVHTDSPPLHWLPML